MSPSLSAHARSWAEAAEGVKYERGRPGYPPAVGAVLAENLALRPGATVVDVAAGTGKLTRVLAESGATTLGVEPMPGMRLQLRQTVPAAWLVAASAEQLPLRSGRADAITVAQAFHWFDLPVASAEFRRVLRPGGRLAVVNNTRDRSVPWVAELGEILKRYERLNPRPKPTRGWWDRLKAGHDFVGWEEFDVPNEQRFASLEDFDARFASVSFAILLPPADRQAMLADLRRAVADIDPLVIPMHTLVRIAKRA